VGAGFPVVAWSQLGACALLASSLTGCGTVVPNIGEAWDGAKDVPEEIRDGKVVHMPISATAQIEFEIKKQIYCELKAAVQTVQWYNNHTDNTVPLIPHDWGASVSLSLQVDESTALNPGVALNVAMANAMNTFGVVEKVGSTTIMPPTTSTPQSFNLGFGVTLSSTATRNDKFDPYYTIEYLLRPSKLIDPSKPPSYDNPAPTCQYDQAYSDPIRNLGYSPAKSSPLVPQASSPLLKNSALVVKAGDSYELAPDVPHIVSQLGLVDWLVGATFANRSIPSVSSPLPKEGVVADKDYKVFLARERDHLRELGYSSDQIAQIVASGAYLEDIQGLQKDGYSRAEIVTYLSQGIAPNVLQQYKDKGYEAPEIKKMVAASTKGSGSKSTGGGGGAGPPPDTLSIEIKFIIVTSGNVTPTWKLLRVTANTSGSLLSLGRTRTHDLIITIGPNNQQTLNTHLASQIGNAVSNGNQAAALSTQ
jgi:hypothetical protein